MWLPQRRSACTRAPARSLDLLPPRRPDTGPALSEAYEPAEALTTWQLRLTELVETKHGLASALHSGDPAFDALPGYFMGCLEPVLHSLLATATATGEICDDVSAKGPHSHQHRAIMKPR
ncbi:hypothetical protein MAUB1S_00258 [Mycolicibacterium aubagnense]